MLADPAVQKLPKPAPHRLVVRERHGCAPSTQAAPMDITNCHSSRKRGDTVRDKRHGPTRQRRTTPPRHAQPLAVVLERRQASPRAKPRERSAPRTDRSARRSRSIGSMEVIATSAVNDDPRGVYSDQHRDILAPRHVIGDLRSDRNDRRGVHSHGNDVDESTPPLSSERSRDRKSLAGVMSDHAAVVIDQVSMADRP
jgi:hypothetical protein